MNESSPANKALVKLDPVFKIPYRNLTLLQLIRSWELSNDWWPPSVARFSDAIEARGC